MNRRPISFFEPLGIPIGKKKEKGVDFATPFPIVYAPALLLAGCSSAEPASSLGR